MGFFEGVLGRAPFKILFERISFKAYIRVLSALSGTLKDLKGP